MAFGTLEGGGHERTRGDEVHEPAEERLLAVDRVVLLGERAVDLDQLEADDLEAALLEPGDDPAHELALDAVGLDEEERALEFRHGGLGLGSGAIPGAPDRGVFGWRHRVARPR